MREEGVRKALALAVVSGCLVGAVAAGSSASRVAAGPKVSIVACKSVVLVKSGSTSYFKCMGQFGLGIPHTLKSIAFLVTNMGFPHGSSMTLNFLNSATGQPLTSPLKLGPIKFDPGLWRVGFNGPFPVLTLKLDVTFNAKTIGSFTFAFV